MPWKGNSSLNSDYFDPDAIAQEVLTGASNANKQSLIPSSSAPIELPSAPTYTTPTKEQFDWNVPVSERPQGTENWIWSRSRWAKENFDNEQKAKEDAAYRKYQTDLQNWQNAITLDNARKEAEQKKLENYNTMLTAQGLTPMTSLGDLPSVQIRQLGQAWQNTTDPTLRDQYHQQALQVAQKAGLIPEGYTGSVNGLVTLSAAGMPSYERTYSDTKYADALKQQTWENEFKERELSADTAYKNASLAQRGSNGGGSSKPTQNDYLSVFMSTAGQYKSPANYKADLQRYKSEIVKYIGVEGWNNLYKDAEAMKQEANPNYVAGTASPLRAVLGL